MFTHKKRILQLILFRVIIATALIVAAVSIQFGTSTFLPLGHYYLVILAIFLLSLIYLLLYYWGVNYSLQCYLQIILDLCVITLLVYISGGLQGSFYFLYIFEIIAAGIVLSGRSAFLTAALSCIFFGALVDGMYFGVIPYYGGVRDSALSPGVFINSIFIAWSVFFLVAVMINYLIKSLHKTRDELELAQKELDVKKNLALAGSTAAHLAHEIRNPLAAISGSVQVLSEELELEDDKKKLMDIIIKESRRVSQSFQHFLTLASPAKTTFSRIKLANIWEEVLTLLQNSGEIHERIKITGNSLDSDVHIYANDSQFKQVFWNITKNAVKAMPEGGTFTVDFQRGRNRNIILSFKDTGVGMEKESQEKIFDPFFSGFDQGLGIGMSVVSRIVGDYEGQIQVLSEPERGTEIKIVLPGALAKNGKKR